jgi:hypothetical protein
VCSDIIIDTVQQLFLFGRKFFLDDALAEQLLELLQFFKDIIGRRPAAYQA